MTTTTQQPIVSFAGGTWPISGNSRVAPPFALSGTQAIHEMSETGTISARTAGEMRKAAQGAMHAAEDVAAKLAGAILHLFADENTARAAIEQLASPRL